MSKQRAKRILGMTIPQWTVLGVLALLICCVFVGGFYWLNSQVAAAYAVPDVPVVDVTPLPSATSLPTETPLPTASPTPITYRSLVPDGWRHYKSDAVPGLEIWLPSAYAYQTEKMKQGTAPIYDDVTAKAVMDLWDPTPSPYMLFTTFDASVRPTFASNLDEMIDTDFATLMRTGRLLERDEFEFQLENYPARRLIFDITLNGVNAGFAVYVVQVGRDLYYLIFATPFNELYTRLPDFDKTIQTFHLGPVVPTPGPSPTPPAPTNTPLQ